MTIGRNIKRIRKGKGISQEELKQKTGIAVETISRWENDKFKPNIKQIERLATALGVSPSELMGTDFEEKVFCYKPLSAYSTSELIEELRKRAHDGSGKEL